MAEGLFCAIESVRKVGSFTIPQSPPYVGASSLYTREPLGKRIATAALPGWFAMTIKVQKNHQKEAFHESNRKKEGGIHPHLH